MSRRQPRDRPYRYSTARTGRLSCLSAYGSLRDQRKPISGADQFLVDEFLNSKIGKFLAIAGPLDSAERQVRRADGRVVDKDHAGFDSASHLLAVLNVFGVD